MIGVHRGASIRRFEAAIGRRAQPLREVPQRRFVGRAHGRVRCAIARHLHQLRDRDVPDGAADGGAGALLGRGRDQAIDERRRHLEQSAPAAQHGPDGAALPA